MNAHSNPAKAAYPLASSSTDPRIRLPSRMLEYGYYLSIFYSVMSPALGLSVGMLGAALLAVLAGLCFMRVRATAQVVYSPLLYPLGCATCYLLIQILVHGDSILSNDSRSFVTWMLALVIVQSLALRPGFLHRFAIALFLIGICMLPYLQVSDSDAERFRLDRSVGFSNANDLGAFFGFCCLYFIVSGIEARQVRNRVACGLAAVGCLYVVGLTVSRGPLFAIAVAAVVGGRRLLKRGFIPILVLVLVAFLAYVSGLFDQVLASYQSRLGLETGRFRVWPLALERFWSSPWFGVGVSNLETYVPGHDDPITPHNGFLHVGLSSGLIALLFFVAYWWRSGRAALFKSREASRDALFYIPLWLYAFLINFQLGLAFMTPWSIAILGAAMSRGSGQPWESASGLRRHRRPLVMQPSTFEHNLPYRHR
jgi:O-antigen ligase